MIDFRRVEGTNSGDLGLVEDLARTTWREHYTPIIGSEQVEYMLRNFQSATAIARQIEEGYAYWLLFYWDDPAGYLAYVKQSDREGFQLSKLYVRSDRRGLGLGKAGLGLVEDRCRQRGLDRIWLTVNKYNSASIAWYYHMGFDHAGAQVADIGGGFVMDDYILEKPLG